MCYKSVEWKTFYEFLQDGREMGRHRDEKKDENLSNFSSSNFVILELKISAFVI